MKNYEEIRKLEEQIERLTHETSQLINTADRKEREGLREYAIRVLQQETEASPPANGMPVDVKPKAPFNPLALAIPLTLAGGILFFLFPAVGIILLLAAALAGTWGILRPLLSRRT